MAFDLGFWLRDQMSRRLGACWTSFSGAFSSEAEDDALCELEGMPASRRRDDALKNLGVVRKLRAKVVINLEFDVAMVSRSRIRQNAVL